MEGVARTAKVRRDSRQVIEGTDVMMDAFFAGSGGKVRLRWKTQPPSLFSTQYSCNIDETGMFVQESQVCRRQSFA